MKEFSIKGRLIVPEELDHHDMLDLLYDLLKLGNIHFAGETKEIKKEEQVNAANRD